MEKHPDWAAVMLFYGAVHAVERLFDYDGIHSCEHSTREYEIKERYQTLWADYRVLKSESLKTRYLHGGVFALTSAKVKKDLHDRRLANIARDIDARIAARTLIKPA